jgi:hypothetical protein
LGRLYAIDRRAPFASELTNGLLLRGQAVVDVRPGEAIRRIALDIAARASDFPGLNGRIRTLYLMGHGDAGLLHFGEGLTAATAPDFAPLWRSLHGGGLGGIRIYGCNVASARPADTHGTGTVESGWQMAGTRANVMAGPGYAMLRELARVTGVAVSAAVIRQHLGYWNIDRLLSGREYQGEVMTVTPWGGFHITRMDAAGDVTVRDSELDFA